MVKFFWKFVYLFPQNTRTWQTDGHHMMAYGMLCAYAICIALHGKNGRVTCPNHWRPVSGKSLFSRTPQCACFSLLKTKTCLFLKQEHSQEYSLPTVLLRCSWSSHIHMEHACNHLNSPSISRQQFLASKPSLHTGLLTPRQLSRLYSFYLLTYYTNNIQPFQQSLSTFTWKFAWKCHKSSPNGLQCKMSSFLTT